MSNHRKEVQIKLILNTVTNHLIDDIKNEKSHLFIHQGQKFCIKSAILWQSTTEGDLQSDTFVSQELLSKKNDPRRHRNSCTLGWKMLDVVAGFLPCSATLQPYLINYLEEISQDYQDPFQGRRNWDKQKPESNPPQVLWIYLV